jgi:hypothetical protein
MMTVIRDYFTINRKKILLSTLKVYLAAVLLTAIVLAQAMVHGATQQIVPNLLTTLLIIIGPLVLSMSLNVVAACILGVRLAHAAGLRLTDYVKSDLYQQHGKATMRVILG